MASIFRTVQWQVGQLVDGVDSGMIQLPDLQRPFVWSTTKVRDLFDSMYRGYPVGELMFWETSGDGDVSPIGQNAHQGANHQIIDGQQRLTSLYATIKGAVIRDTNYRKKRIVLSYNPFTERFEVRTPAFAKSVHWVEDISTVFVSPYRAKQNFLRRFEKSEGELRDADAEQVETALQRLFDLHNYQFSVVQLDTAVEKGQVAEVFVRINSEGAPLKSSDFILTWLSVFWPEGRERIERFAHFSRLTPTGASEYTGERITWTPINPFVHLATGDLVRALVAVGLNRARLQDAYTALQAKDPTTGDVNSENFEQRLRQLKEALPVVLNEVNWTEFIRSLQLAGFRSRKNITSTMNIIYSYVLFLLGRTRFKVDLTTLRQLIAQWVFMSQLTKRYTGSSESQMTKDLRTLDSVQPGDADGFIELLSSIITSQLPADYWSYTVPDSLKGSNALISPTYQCYLAALNILDAKMFMLNMPVAEWMDPHLPMKKGLEIHHLFPRAYLMETLGIDDLIRTNQVANYAPTDWHTNVKISARAPSEYWPDLVVSSGLSETELERQRYWHALPSGWQDMNYEEFLIVRRELISQVIRDGFEKLRTGVSTATAPVAEDISSSDEVEATLATFVEARLLQPGHLLDPVDPDWAVDAVITNDGTLMIDGEHEFDSLDEATLFLNVDNISGLEFWALENGKVLVPLVELAQNLR